MVGAIGVVGTFAATALAQASIQWRDHSQALEKIAGFTLIGALGMVGAALPHFC
jgi:cytochrome c biogenesis protein CcdA